jgi:hypothetical protein
MDNLPDESADPPKADFAPLSPLSKLEPAASPAPPLSLASVLLPQQAAPSLEPGESWSPPGPLPIIFTDVQKQAFLQLKALGLGDAKACIQCGTNRLNLRATYQSDPQFAAQSRDLEDAKVETCKEVMLATITNDVPSDQSLPFLVRSGLAKTYVDQDHSHRSDRIRLGIERKRLAQSLTAIQNNIRISNSIPRSLGGTPGDVLGTSEDERRMMISVKQLDDKELVEYNNLFGRLICGSHMNTDELCRYAILQQKILSSSSVDMNDSSHQQSLTTPQQGPSEPIITIESVDSLYAQTGTTQEDQEHKSRSEKLNKNGANGNGKHTK